MIMNLNVFTSSVRAISKRTARYTNPAKIISINKVGKFLTKPFVANATTNIMTAAKSCLTTGFVNENSTYFFATINTNIEVAETKNEAAATPL